MAINFRLYEAFTGHVVATGDHRVVSRVSPSAHLIMRELAMHGRYATPCVETS